MGSCDHDVRLTAITVGLLKMLIQILHHPDKMVQGSWPKVKDKTFYVSAPTLEVGISFGLWTLCLGLSLITSVPLFLGCFPLVPGTRVLRLVSFNGTVYFGLGHSLLIFLTLVLIHYFLCRNS